MAAKLRKTPIITDLTCVFCLNKAILPRFIKENFLPHAKPEPFTP